MKLSELLIEYWQSLDTQSWEEKVIQSLEKAADISAARKQSKYKGEHKPIVSCNSPNPSAFDSLQMFGFRYAYHYNEWEDGNMELTQSQLEDLQGWLKLYYWRRYKKTLQTKLII